MENQAIAECPAPSILKRLGEILMSQLDANLMDAANMVHLEQQLYAMCDSGELDTESMDYCEHLLGRIYYYQRKDRH